MGRKFAAAANGVDTNWGTVKIGVYARHLEWWLQYFPMSQLLFVSGERLIVDPAFEMGRVQVRDVGAHEDYHFLRAVCENINMLFSQ